MDAAQSWLLGASRPTQTPVMYVPPIGTLKKICIFISECVDVFYIIVTAVTALGCDTIATGKYKFWNFNEDTNCVSWRKGLPPFREPFLSSLWGNWWRRRESWKPEIVLFLAGKSLPTFRRYVMPLSSTMSSRIKILLLWHFRRPECSTTQLCEYLIHRKHRLFPEKY
jgi:hypothetical protein